MDIDIEVKPEKESEINYACPYEECDKQYSRPSLLEQHLRTHSNERPYVCQHPGCEKSFFRSSHLKSHQRFHTRIKPFTCTYEGCSSSFYTLQHLLRHEVIHKKPKPYVCTWEGCSQRFVKHQQLRLHIANEHTHASPFPCTHAGCTQGFSTKQKLQNHISRIHEKVVTYKCPHESCIDSPGFEKWSQLQGHIREAHVPTCSLCGRRFRSAAHLRHHVTLHMTTLEERKSFKCSYEGCSKSFTRSSALRKHNHVIHEGALPFSCPNCGTKFGYKHMLQRHSEKSACLQSSISPVNETSRPNSPVSFFEDTCKVDLSHTSSNVEQVVNQLTGYGYEDNRLFPCLVPGCEYRFKRLYDLQRHGTSYHDIPSTEINTLNVEAMSNS
ncbi:RNA polymerase III transcription factor tfiiia [Schizosaccharomyces cryophilus OY26]|uniref:Wilms tumor protein homolog n=1 Tax=Schizosaccharomyces cryophilus (strain OY26 / ATCC MYA-4695 / CBS 11777 / NBRC 106824 / NRRL Y48691) TaxID=653667 RepID=S9X043_SCHCR|nr:RNA polymerase III transcription factor tfiiia [Schizosaccharomyces cryophilus OY26]EPY50312.1 RNA polymerase III transcription factor tfiiia [Schizosaccharomyces cryophilus OY26]